MKNRTTVFIVLLCLLTGLLTLTSALRRHTPSAQAADFTRLDVPAVTHGFTKTANLPDGDLFLLPRPTTLAIAEVPEGTHVAPVNFDTFGGTPDAIGALTGTQPQVLAVATPNAKVRAVSCAESIWDSNLFIAAGGGGSEGDQVRLYLENSDGTPGHELALFTVKFGGVEVTRLHKDLMLFVNDRYARGPSTHEGEIIPLATFAGESGQRTGLLTFAWPMTGFSPLQGCYRLGVEVARGAMEGRTSVVVADIVVNRNRAPGDENNAGEGLLARLVGGYPSGFPCKAECPFPGQIPEPPLPNPGGDGDGAPCNAICYRSPQYFLLNINRLPRGTVLVGGANFNRPVSTTNTQVMRMALQGGFTPLQRLNQEFVAAQLNMLNAGGDGSPKVFYALESKLSCYGLQFDDITLSNGFVITPDTQLKDLYQNTRFCIWENRIDDMAALTRIFDLLNGNNPLAACNYAWQ